MRLIAICLLGAALAAGCARAPEPAPGSRPSPAERPAVLSVSKVAFDGRHAGYIKVKTSAAEANRAAREDEVLVFWVYDALWNPAGYYTRGGRTYRLSRARGGADFDDLGILPTEAALRTLLGGGAESAVEIRAMDSPRTIEGDKATAREAAAKAAKEKEAAAPAEPKEE